MSPSRSEAAILVVSTGDRMSDLTRFLDSVAEHTPLLAVVACLQEYPASYEHPQLVTAIRLPERCGPHAARMAALDAVGTNAYRAWIIADDDMLLLPVTNYRPMIRKVLDRPDVGLVSGNWRRTPQQASNVERRPEFTNQAIVFTGGGMAMSADTLELIRTSLPAKEPFVCDNTEWSLVAYLNGKINGRYLGSQAAHAVTGSGGRRAWLRKTQGVRPRSEYVDVVECKPFYPHRANNMLSPNDSRLTDAARRLHQQQRTSNYPDAPRKVDDA